MHPVEWGTVTAVLAVGVQQALWGGWLIQGHTGEVGNKAPPSSFHLLVLSQPPPTTSSLGLDQLFCVSQGPWQPLLDRDLQPFRAIGALGPGLFTAQSEAQ